MANDVVLALFDDLAPVTGVMGRLREMGLPDDSVAVMSSVPYEPQMLGRRKVRDPMPRVALLGAILGIATALSLLAATFLLYPLHQGGQPIVPIPPSLIILFEITMLGTMWTAFFGFFAVNRLPPFGKPVYDSRITLGKIGVVVRPDQSQTLDVERVLREAGASDLQQFTGSATPDRRAWARFAVAVAAILVAAAGVSLLFFYDVISVPFPSNMVHQASVAFEQGPRLAAPAAAVPLQGPVLIADEPASEPVPMDDASLQRGEVLFGIDCAICHGASGTGDGTLSGYFSPKPANLTSEDVQGSADADIFLVITQGRGLMPSLAENLSVVSRWDVINFVRNLSR
jgi:mono/diheme cytochrome c family protein